LQGHFGLGRGAGSLARRPVQDMIAPRFDQRVSLLYASVCQVFTPYPATFVYWIFDGRRRDGLTSSCQDPSLALRYPSQPPTNKPKTPSIASHGGKGSMAQPPLSRQGAAASVRRCSGAQGISVLRHDIKFCVLGRFHESADGTAREPLGPGSS